MCIIENCVFLLKYKSKQQSKKNVLLSSVKLITLSIFTLFIATVICINKMISTPIDKKLIISKSYSINRVKI